MPHVAFGNISPISKPVDDETGVASIVKHDHITRTTTEVNVPAEWEMSEAFTTLTHPNGIWGNHSDAPPAWVECPDWPELEAALRGYYGCAGRPKKWDHEIGEPAASAAASKEGN